MKIASVIGARPQFIKCAPMSRCLRGRADEVLIHTGQHYDKEMSDVFFSELGIPAPAHNLGVGSGPHGRQTGQMLSGLEEVFAREKPDKVVIFGDTNSTLAGALAAAKMGIPLAHVEAGLRSFNRAMPEEINRIVADRLSSLLFCPTETAVKNLQAEGIAAGVHLVGDVMRDEFMRSLAAAGPEGAFLQGLGLTPGGYALATVHRAENTDNPGRLREIIAGLEDIAGSTPVVWPIHPRARAALKREEIPTKALTLLPPASFREMLTLEKNSRIILTDSGGVQKEAFWLKIPCITLRDESEWVETLASGWNRLAPARRDAIRAAYDAMLVLKSDDHEAAPENASEKIVALLLS